MKAARPAKLRAQAMDHDGASRGAAQLLRPSSVGGGIGNVERPVEAGLWQTVIDPVDTFRSLLVALAALGSGR